MPAAAPPLLREHRLYQADWLMRFYGFAATELTTDERPNLSVEHDPKTAWALRHRELFPVDLNRASRWKLLRVPGLGVRNVERILRIRRHHAIRLEDLQKLRVSLKKVRAFVVVADHNPGVRLLDRGDLGEKVAGGEQLELFTAARSAGTAARSKCRKSAPNCRKKALNRQEAS